MHEINGTQVFVISGRGNVRTTRNNNSFLECRSDQGVIAFWGSEHNRHNIDQILAASLPCQVECEIAAASPNFSHDHWIPEHGRINLLSGSKHMPPKGTPSR